MIRLDTIGIIFSAGTPDENSALKNVSLDVHQSDFITVIGSNGAGKSTLYNIIAGTLKPSSGHIFISTNTERGIQEHDITRESEHCRAHYIGRIFQNPLLGTAGKMTLADNMMICHKKGYKGLKISLNKKMRDYFAERLCILDMGLENRLNDNVDQFSGGQRQALTLLMAVLSHPSLLLLDEHTAALDPRNAQIVMDLTHRFAQEYKLTVMMITHNMTHAIEYGNRLLMMDAGEIILDIGKVEKEGLTTDNLVERFRSIRNKNLSNDQMLLR